MNNIYTYNNNFISLINLIIFLKENKIKPSNIKPIGYNPTLFDNTINLNLKLNDNIINKITNEIGLNNLNIIMKIFLSTDEFKELIIYYFYLNSIKYKEKVIYMRNLKCVSSALKIAKYVSREAHKFKGFTRFKELENFCLYAEIEPTNNILILISKHFASRLKNEYWIIKDIKRNILSIYDKKNYYIVSENEFKLHDKTISNNEKNIEELWKDFYKTICIKTRKNDRCRMNFMPKKYWKNIIEMSDEI